VFESMTTHRSTQTEERTDECCRTTGYPTVSLGRRIHATMRMPQFQRVAYSALNSKQQEIFNFQKVSGLLAEYGYATLRLSDDWNGADFLAVHIDGKTTLRVQLKGRLTFQKKYQGKNLWVCFRHNGLVYLYPHDSLLAHALKVTNIGSTESWRKENGGYSFPGPPESLAAALRKHCLGHESTPTAALYLSKDHP
jgi:hypothetical protein